jgi:predicted GIY-YIG superfamily endonuclease
MTLRSSRRLRAKQGGIPNETIHVKCVYLLQSQSRPDQRYIGITHDLDSRLSDHNSGRSKHTAKFAPWECVVAVWFRDDQKAEAFEMYLKQGSGHAFACRHLW